MFDRTTCWQEGCRAGGGGYRRHHGITSVMEEKLVGMGFEMANMRNKQPWNRLHTRNNSSIDQRDTAKQKALRQDALNTLAGVITLLPATALR